ncbi:hypothetical protein ABKA04_007965 [Annulohypoxylon sp. FPYF3050]
MKSNAGDISSQIQGPYTVDVYYAMLWKVIDELCIRVGADFELTLDALRSPALRGLFGVKRDPRRCNVSDSDINGCLLGAAAYLGYLPLVDQLEKKKLNGYYDPLDCSFLFPCPLFLAALSGNIEIWRDLQKHYLDPETKIALSISGALRCDDMNMLREIDTVLDISKGSSLIYGHTYMTLSLDTFHFVKERWNLCDPKGFDWSVLFYGAEQGNVDIVRHLLLVHSQDHSWDNNKVWKLHLLFKAIRQGREEMVSLLLEHGIHPHDPCAADFEMEGDLTTLHKLIDNGVDINRWYHSLVRFALRQEYTRLLEFMLGRRVCNPILKNRLKEFALKRGLESMAEILQQHIENDPIRYLKRCDVELEVFNIRGFKTIWNEDVPKYVDNNETVYGGNWTAEIIIDSLDNHIIADES